MPRRILFLIAACLLPACAPPMPPGQLGFSDSKRVVIAGENVRQEIAAYYQKEYDALVWFTPYRGSVANAADNLWESGLGPSRAMWGLINELNSINGSIGRWQIIVPKIAEKYFLKALKNMKTNALAKARGMVI